MDCSFEFEFGPNFAFEDDQMKFGVVGKLQNGFVVIFKLILCYFSYFLGLV